MDTKIRLMIQSQLNPLVYVSFPKSITGKGRVKLNDIERDVTGSIVVLPAPETRSELTVCLEGDLWTDEFASQITLGTR